MIPSEEFHDKNKWKKKSLIMHEIHECIVLGNWSKKELLYILETLKNKL